LEEGEGDAGEGDAGSGSEESSSPRRPTQSISLVGFIRRVEEMGGELRHGRRAAFTPGGKGSRFCAGAAAPRFGRPWVEASAVGS
jgi:hypothetical protein